MTFVESEGDDLFFDSYDWIRSPADSPAGKSPELGSFENAFFRHGELKSVRERRSRFLHGMGFTELLSPPVNGRHGVQEPTGDGAPEVTASISTTMYGSLPAPAEAEERSARDLHKDGSGCGSMALQKLESYSESVRGSIERRDSVSSKEKNQKKGINHRERKSGGGWWRDLMKRRQEIGLCKNNVATKHSTLPRAARTQVQRHRKRCMEFTALYKGQELRAHKGSIKVLRFNASGWLLASGGEDCVVRVWRVVEEEASCKLLNLKDASLDNVGGGGKVLLRRRSSGLAPVIIPKTVFKIKETPLHEFRGHTSDILDISWSSSDCILSSSKDKTVRLWKVGSDDCLRVFQHNDYVTCIQFNPIDEKYFISGSLDGKIRVWGVAENRVLDWADLREIVTALCYKPDGMGFVVGSITGSCRMFDCSGGNMRLSKQLGLQGKKKSTGKCITGLQFSPDDSHRIMINSADSNIRIVNGVDVVHKFRGLRKSKSQQSASFTWDGRYAVSVDGDSRIYIWNTGEPFRSSSSTTTKGAKTVRSCELFSSDGATVAVPWPRSGREASCMLPLDVVDAPPPTPARLQDKDRFSLGSWFFPDGSSRGSATWPEEKLSPCNREQPQQQQNHHDRLILPASAPWSLVIVSANEDGTIRSYHNYGLPVRP